MKSVLLIAPTFLNLYIDLKIEWEKRGYNVTYIEEESAAKPLEREIIHPIFKKEKYPTL